MFQQWEPTPDAPIGRYLGKFKVTFYWVVEEEDYTGGRTSALYDAGGKLLGKFPPAFVKAFKTESAARLRDGTRISYLKRRNRAEVVDQFNGFGGYKLTELQSVAVDPRLVPLGSRLYVPQAGGVTVNGKPLTGVFYAHDIGSAIKGKRIDIFIGDKENMAAFGLAGMGSSSSVDVYLLE
jgi:3D (Asp-Asp-Asp) domain-containing protein